MLETFRLNEPHVACEQLEGDMILLNFESGFYYNIRGIGADLCQHLLAGGSTAVAAANLASTFGLPESQIARDVEVFVNQLLGEKLMVRTSNASNNSSLKITATAYEAPCCEKFDDMADQLLLDKIDDQSKEAQWSPTPSF